MRCRAPQFVSVEAGGNIDKSRLGRVVSAQSFTELTPGANVMTTNPASRGSPAPVWNLTRDRNPNFTGRTEILEELRQRMVDGQRVQAIHGLGGIGKSQTSVEYAYLFRNDYAIVWWIR